MLMKEFEDLNEKVQKLSLEAIKDVKNRFASLKNGSYTKKYSTNLSSRITSTNRDSIMLPSS